MTVLRKDRLWQQFSKEPWNDRQRSIVNRMLNGFKGFLSTSKYAKRTKCSPDTALRDIRAMVEKGILQQNSSGGRSTSYRLADLENTDPPQ